MLEGGGEGGGEGDIGCPLSWGIPSSSLSHSEGVGHDAGEGEGVKHVTAELGGEGGAWLSAPAAGSGSGISISSTSSLGARGEARAAGRARAGGRVGTGGRADSPSTSTSGKAAAALGLESERRRFGSIRASLLLSSRRRAPGPRRLALLAGGSRSWRCWRCGGGGLDAWLRLLSPGLAAPPSWGPGCRAQGYAPSG